MCLASLLFKLCRSLPAPQTTVDSPNNTSFRPKAAHFAAAAEKPASALKASFQRIPLPLSVYIAILTLILSKGKDPEAPDSPQPLEHRFICQGPKAHAIPAWGIAPG